MASTGKIFEEDFFKSCLPLSEDGTISIDRFYDAMGGFKGINNICDYAIFRYPLQLYVELKAHEGKSIPFSQISENQWTGLLKKSKIKGVTAGLLLKFNLKDGTSPVYFMDIRMADELRESGERKSISLDNAIDWGRELIGTKKRTRYTYDILALFKTFYQGG